MGVNSPIVFKITTPERRLSPDSYPAAFLIRDAWNDWFKFITQFYLVVFDEHGKEHQIGHVKIGQFGMESGSPTLSESFAELDDQYFSLGQDDSYYEALKTLGDRIRIDVLSQLNDVAYDLSLFERIIHERVTQDSLLRSVKLATVRGQFHRIASGGARLSKYRFSYTAPGGRAGPPPVTLSFEVLPESSPPTNVHVLIGRNGVGKSYLMHCMARALLAMNEGEGNFGHFRSSEDDDALFSNLVLVTFSAFDAFDPPSEEIVPATGLQYSYVGLKRISGDTVSDDAEELSGTPKSPEALMEEFAQCARLCAKGPRAERWHRAMESLELDAVFREADLTNLASADSSDVVMERARELFRRLSSGQRIVLLTIARLIETVEERTLVLIDEPEAHLHPPLLSAFVRALSGLLINRNGVAVIATHSPVVLQEVPSRCVWKLRRNGREVRSERPEIETFGENVGILTREAFGFEVTHSGFHALLRGLVANGMTFEEILHRFGNQLGAEARAIVRSLLLSRDNGP